MCLSNRKTTALHVSTTSSNLSKQETVQFFSTSVCKLLVKAADTQPDNAELGGRHFFRACADRSKLCSPPPPRNTCGKLYLPEGGKHGFFLSSAGTTNHGRQLQTKQNKLTRLGKPRRIVLEKVNGFHGFCETGQSEGSISF